MIVSFFTGDPRKGGSYLGSSYYSSISSGKRKTVSATWDTTGYSSEVEVYVMVDITEQLDELEEGNNRAYITVDVISEEPEPGDRLKVYMPIAQR